MIMRVLTLGMKFVAMPSMLVSVLFMMVNVWFVINFMTVFMAVLMIVVIMVLLRMLFMLLIVMMMFFIGVMLIWLLIFKLLYFFYYIRRLLMSFFYLFRLVYRVNCALCFSYPNLQLQIILL